MYAVEAGLVDRYLVPVSMQAPRGKKPEWGEKATGRKKKVKEESFVFDLDYFLINKKVFGHDDDNDGGGIDDGCYDDGCIDNNDITCTVVNGAI